MQELLSAARAAKKEVSRLDTQKKNEALEAMAAALISRQDRILAANEQDLQAVAEIQADNVILEGDTKNAVGGTGICADWSLLAKRNWNRPFFLAGGLKPENVAEAISIVQPDGIDLASGIEENGVKSPEKMKQIITIIRGA